MSANYCSQCSEEKYNEERKVIDGIVYVKVIYMCGSYIELRRIGRVWKHIGTVIRCGALSGREGFR